MNSKTFQLSLILKSSKAHVTNHFWFTLKNFDFVFWFTFLINFSFVVCILTVGLFYDAFCCFFWYDFITIYNIEVKIAMSRPLFEQENFLQVRGTGYNLLSPVWDQKTLLNDFIDLSGLVKHSVDSLDMHTGREMNYGYMGIYTFSGRWNGKFCGSIDNIWM